MHQLVDSKTETILKTAEEVVKERTASTEKGLSGKDGILAVLGRAADEPTSLYAAWLTILMRHLRHTIL